MTGPPTATRDTRRGTDAAVGQPFQQLRRTLMASSVSVFGRNALPTDLAGVVPLLEADSARVIAGFDYSVPCVPLGRALGVEPKHAGCQLAAQVVEEDESGLLVGAEVDGPYLNLRVDRKQFAQQVVDCAYAGNLGWCDHDDAVRKEFCLVSPDSDPEADLVGLLSALAARCSRRPVDQLPGRSDEVEALIAELISSGRAELDPSGLTEAVLTGSPGDRWLVRSATGDVTVPALVAARLRRSNGRPVLLAVGNENRELVGRIEHVVEPPDGMTIDLRSVVLDDRWRRLSDVVEPAEAPVSGEGVIDLRVRPSTEGVSDAPGFAVLRGLARLPDVSHRALATADPDYLLRFVSAIVRRVDLAQSTEVAGIDALRAVCTEACRVTVPASAQVGDLVEA